MFLENPVLFRVENPLWLKTYLEMQAARELVFFSPALSRPEKPILVENTPSVIQGSQ